MLLLLLPGRRVAQSAQQWWLDDAFVRSAILQTIRTRSDKIKVLCCHSMIFTFCVKILMPNQQSENSPTDLKLVQRNLYKLWFKARIKNVWVCEANINLICMTFMRLTLVLLMQTHIAPCVTLTWVKSFYQLWGPSPAHEDGFSLAKGSESQLTFKKEKNPQKNMWLTGSIFHPSTREVLFVNTCCLLFYVQQS